MRRPRRLRHRLPRRRAGPGGRHGARGARAPGGSRVHSPGQLATADLSPPAPGRGARSSTPSGRRGTARSTRSAGGWPTTSGCSTSAAGCARPGCSARPAWLRRTAPATGGRPARATRAGHRALRRASGRPATSATPGRRDRRWPSAAGSALPDRELRAADLRAAARGRSLTAAASRSHGDAAATSAGSDRNGRRPSVHRAYNERSAAPTGPEAHALRRHRRDRGMPTRGAPTA